MEQSFIAFLEDSIKKNWDLDALTDYKGATLQYKDVARKIEKLTHHLRIKRHQARRQDSCLWPQQFSLGSYFPGCRYIRGSDCSHSSRIQIGQHS